MRYAVLMGLMSLGLCWHAEAGSGKAGYDVGFPKSGMTAQGCMVTARGSFDCEGSRDADVFVNTSAGLGTIVFTGGSDAEERENVGCNCSADLGVSAGHWSCQCLVGHEGSAIMMYSLSCRGKHTGSNRPVSAPHAGHHVKCH